MVDFFRDVPNSIYPDLIIVNNKYMIANRREYLDDQIKPIDANRFAIITGNSYVGGHSLFILLTRIQYFANYSSYVVHSFGEYSDAMAKRIEIRTSNF